MISATPKPIGNELAGSGTGVLTNDSESVTVDAKVPVGVFIKNADRLTVKSPGRSMETSPSVGGGVQGANVVAQAVKLPVMVAGRTKLVEGDVAVREKLSAPAVTVIIGETIQPPVVPGDGQVRTNGIAFTVALP